MRFDYNAYEEMISLLHSCNYKICGYKDYKMYQRCAILRHDVDMSLEKSVEMAEVENRLGVESTYFILLTSDFYNIASLKSQRLIRKIQDLGHNVGLHFDEVRYGDITDYEQIKEYIGREIEITESLLQSKIDVVSMHRPSRQILDMDLELPNNVINSYSEEYFKNFKYISDSRRCWRENVLDVIKEQKEDRLHILTHAIWYGHEEYEMKEVLMRFIDSAKQDRYNALCDNIKNMEQVISREEI